MEAACAWADIVLPSEVDGMLIWDEPDPARQLDRYQTLGAPEVALTLGPGGVRLRFPSGETTLPGMAAKVVDTSGAGDSFNGAYLAARLRDEPPEDAAHAGLTLAARVVSASGALPSAQVSHPDPCRESLT